MRFLSKPLLPILLGAMLCAASHPARAQDKPDTIAQARQALNEKSYGRAIELFRAAKAAGPVRESERVNYELTLALFKSEKWDEAIAAANEGIQTASWKARFHYLLGQIYVKVPHRAWKIGDKTIRSEEYPEVKDGETPQAIYLADSDQKAALENLEKAKTLAEKERRDAKQNRYFAPIYPLAWNEECDLNLDLAAFLPQATFNDWVQELEKRTGNAPFDEAIDTNIPYSTGWSLPKKVLFLYAQIRTLDQGDDKAKSQRSLLGEGLFLDAYKRRMDAWADKYDPDTQKNIKRPYPFQKLNANAPLRNLVDTYPKSPLAPQTLALLAQHQPNAVEERKVWRELIEKYPRSKWVNDARAAIREIEKREIGFSVQGTTKPDVKPHLSLQTRNVKEVFFAAYRVKLEDFLLAPKPLNDPNASFTAFDRNFGSFSDLTGKLGEPVARWKFTTKDNGDYTGQDAELDVPVSDMGAYVVVASAGNVRFGQIIVISDLSLLKKSDVGGSFVWVCDAKSGAKVSGASVVIKETWDYDPRKVSVARGSSDADGFFDKKRAGDQGSNFAAFAFVGNRYALTSGQGSGWWNNDSQPQPKVLGYTARPVYRPGQTVNFRFVATTRAQGNDRQVVKDHKFSVTATDSRGTKLWEGNATTNEFGSLSGEFPIPASTTLGVCNLSISDDKDMSGGASFRVEEYKRPEFEVTVTAPKEVKKPGENVEAQLSARYYFGAPVPNAKVKYTVRKSSWWASFHFPSPYDWLLTSWGMNDYGNRRNIGGEGSGEIVYEGETTTDADGKAKIAFQTQSINNPTPQPRYGFYPMWQANPLYTIEAEITDSSRRTIEAQGQVKVANQPYFAFLNVERGYFQKGDRVPIELRTQDANEVPVKANGLMRVFRLLPGDKEEKVLEQPISTDATGRATWTWEANESGQFRVEFEGQTDWGDKPMASQEIWVVGDKVGQIRLRGVTILLDKESYEEGQTVRARLVADKPGANVLFTQEANGQILKRQIVPIPEQSVEVAIPINKTHVPNFFLGAALVQDYEVSQAQAEVIVPPTRQLLKLDVKGDKSTYKPGETGTFQVSARDWSGAPARAEVSLALIDASLFYIQGDSTPDVRSFFYGDRRGNSVNLDSSRSGNIEPRREAPTDPDIETHSWELPDDFGQLQLQPGNVGWYPYGVRFARSRDMLAEGGAGGMASEMMADAAAPVMAPAPSSAPAGAMAKSAVRPENSGDVGPVRTNFAETAYWSPAVITDNGTATVKVTFPDSLTQWHATARGLTNTVEVGSAESDTATKKDLLVRLQAPRFFVEKDKVVVSANIHNYSDSQQSVSYALAAVHPGLEITGQGAQGRAQDTVLIPAGGEKRVDWLFNVTQEGQTSIQVSAKTNTDSDAVKLSFPVLTHGAPQFAAHTGIITADGATKIPLTFPKQRQFGATQLNLQMNPSLAATALDALPYLADYPYGCVEQTMSRFLPSALVERSLQTTGVNLQTLRARAQAYAKESKAESVQARVKNSGYTFPKGEPASRDLEEMSSQMWYHDRGNNPIYDGAEIDKMTKEGLQRLASMQRSDGGWGWFPGASESDEYMSAYVVYGLSQARAAKIEGDTSVLNRGRSYLQKQMKDEDNLHLLAYMAYALSQVGVDGTTKGIAAGRLFEQRDRLTPLSKSYLAMTLFKAGEKDKANVLIRNLENTVKVDVANGTARYQTQASYWYWWNNDVETIALALRAFDEIEPTNKLVPMFAKWLTLNSRGNHWRSTKETAEVVYTLAAYVARHRELDVNMTVNVNLNGQLARTYHITADNALWFDNRFRAGDLFLESGDKSNTLTIEKKGRGKLYFSAYEDSFSREDPIKGSGNELEVGRTFYKLTRAETKPDANPTQGGAQGQAKMGAALMPRIIVSPFPPRDSVPPAPEYKRAVIKDGAQVKSGDLIEVELVVNAKNDYEYLLFEDMKAAGFEPVDVRSGYDSNDNLSYYVEMRDDKTAFFVSNLPQGRRVLRYRVRAEVPGTFHALPTNGYAMYAPEVRATSDELRVNITE
ncbi:hypothetical protein IAD21_03156 [Abditibacteriota bacterium]|nr:hypothetical protein IAD21_03156 [Abditibacteriota bacterium]